MSDEIFGVIIWGLLLAIPVICYFDAVRTADRLDRRRSAPRDETAL